jgi:DNA-binding transcriptional LysR family regulator
VLLDIANTHDVFERVASFRSDLGFIEGTHSHPELSVQQVAPRRDRGGRRRLATRWPERRAGARQLQPGHLGAARARLRHAGSLGPLADPALWHEMEVELELGSNEAVKRVVRAGLGLGCLSRLAVQEAIAEGWLVEVATTLPPMHRTLSIVSHRAKKLGGAAAGFLHHCTTD